MILTTETRPGLVQQKANDAQPIIVMRPLLQSLFRQQHAAAHWDLHLGFIHQRIHVSSYVSSTPPLLSFCCPVELFRIAHMLFYQPTSLYREHLRKRELVMREEHLQKISASSSLCIEFELGGRERIRNEWRCFSCTSFSRRNSI